ncbi:MAG: zinc-ribbon domain-containing protein [Anaerolineales bacterium]|jgi:hypothetical protein|nr:zinc-ribbon domain-containing protein [Anaerolineales bacterium]
MMRRFRLFGLVLLLLLTACVPILRSDVEITLGSKEKWEVRLDFVMPSEAQSSLALVSESLDGVVNQLLQKGAQAEWKQLESDDAGNLLFEVQVKWQGFENFNEFVGENVITYLDPEQEKVSFRMSPTALSVGALETRLTLKGGKIRQTNGAKQGSRTVVWTNAGQTLEVVMDNPGKSNALAYGLIAGGIGLLAFAGLGLSGVLHKPRLKQEAAQEDIYVKPVFTPPASPNSIYCGHCGASVPAHAVFCPECGKQIK